MIAVVAVCVLWVVVCGAGELAMWRRVDRREFVPRSSLDRLPELEQ